ncbi:hypothetical protein [Mesorhizobium sp.]|uniref:hypothetical protein n=1 Tax=Mesorhizobium sp. TaxID=1871066 RepID=UPI000FE98401|nr:hypothetical protein [Mesorhizobium sp.]RWA98388.1 MAG: hypothetical protein EOQ37_33380 [Mesorhizobium sp.]RWP42372.1 MAG: hypothetical protein EOR05_29520 [Mesorhizobium sp.]
MQTRGDAIVNDAETVLDRMRALGHETFSRSDLAELIEPFTSRMEFFLKAVVFPTASRRTNLYQLIDNLAGFGAQSSTVAALHHLRELYNDSKHDPDKELKWRRCVDTLSGAVDALKDLAGLKLATVDAVFEPDLSSVVYVGFWDHYTGGETEVGLFLPSDHWLGTSPTISTFHLPISSWEKVKPLLAGHPRYARGEEALGQVLWKSFSDEDDFLDAGVWEGDVRELLTLLSSFNDESLEMAVIPFLARRNDLLSVGVALVSAAVDVARGDPNLAGPALKMRVSDRAKSEYAAETGTPHGQAVLDRVVELLERVPAGQRVSMVGPAFRRARNEPTVQNGVPVLLEGTTFIWLIA